MITDWTSDDGERVRNIVPVIWRDGPNRCRLHHRPEMGGWCYGREIDGEWVYAGDLAPDLALAILRDHAREHLLDHGIDIRSERIGKLRVWFAWVITEARNLLGIASAHEDYDRLQIAAVLAAGEDK